MEPSRKIVIRRRLGVGLLLVLAVAMVSCSVVDRLVTGAILHPERKGLDAPLPEGMKEKSYVMSDQVVLKAWEAEPTGKPDAVILVLHGIADSKATQAGTLGFLAKRGIVGIAPDLRAHGESGGSTATYGYRERKDIIDLRKAAEKEYPGVPVGLWGSSYGAAVALQAMGEDPEFDFAIIENTFADLRDIARQQVVNHTWLPVSDIGPHFINRAGEVAGFDPGKVSPEKSAESVRVPVLHMHGSADKVIPLEHGRRIASHARGKRYRFVPISKGTHFHLSSGDPETYSREVSDFLDRVAGGK